VCVFAVRGYSSDRWQSPPWALRKRVIVTQQQLELEVKLLEPFH
jgi:hypothetical protein